MVVPASLLFSNINDCVRHEVWTRPATSLTDAHGPSITFFDPGPESCNQAYLHSNTLPQAAIQPLSKHLCKLPIQSGHVGKNPLTCNDRPEFDDAHSIFKEDIQNAVKPSLQTRHGSSVIRPCMLGSARTYKPLQTYLGICTCSKCCMMDWQELRHSV